jgi:hypothetical protein
MLPKKQFNHGEHGGLGESIKIVLSRAMRPLGERRDQGRRLLFPPCSPCPPWLIALLGTMKAALANTDDGVAHA